MFEHQQLLSGTRTSGYCSIRNSGLVSNQDLGIKNSSGYMCLYTISIQYILQRPLTKYLQCPLSIPTHVFSVHCPYKLLSISTIFNIKVDQHQSRSSNAVKQIATIPCNLSLMASFADTNVSQGSVAIYARCGAFFIAAITPISWLKSIRLNTSSSSDVFFAG